MQMRRSLPTRCGIGRGSVAHRLGAVAAHSLVVQSHGGDVWRLAAVAVEGSRTVPRRDALVGAVVASLYYGVTSMSTQKHTLRLATHKQN